MTGTLEFDDQGNVERDVTVTASATVLVPQECTTGGGIARCTILQTAINTQPGASGTCTAMGNDCECDITYTDTTNDSSTYTVNDGVLSVSRLGNTATYHYCVSGGTLQAKEFGQNAQEDDFTQLYSAE